MYGETLFVSYTVCVNHVVEKVVNSTPCVGQEGRARIAGLSLPLCPFVPPLSPPFIHTYVYVRGVCELSVVEQRFVLCAEGVLQ